VAKHRVGRVGEALKEEISQILRDIKDPRVGFLTVTGVEVAPDLGYAKVYVSILGDEEKVNESMQALKRAAGFVRSEVGKRMSLRHTPEISFKLDSSLEQGARIAHLLTEVMEEQADQKEKE
jgi:ribosome-binding factor A